MVALVDADSLLYKATCVVEETDWWNECEVLAGLETEKDISKSSDLEVCKEVFDKIIDDITEYTGIEDMLLVFTGSDNFRNNNPLGYKEHRKDMEKPLYIEELLQYALINYNSKLCTGYEADDYVVYLKTTFPDDYLLCAIDKDVLYQTVGTHYNYNTGEEVTTTPQEAIYYAYYQTLVGDTSDGYKGCPQIGDKRARKILDDVLDSCTPWANQQQLEKAYWEAVVKAYESKGLSEWEALHTMRLANMHQLKQGKITLWEPPK